MNRRRVVENEIRNLKNSIKRVKTKIGVEKFLIDITIKYSISEFPYQDDKVIQMIKVHDELVILKRELRQILGNYEDELTQLTTTINKPLV